MQSSLLLIAFCFLYGIIYGATDAWQIIRSTGDSWHGSPWNDADLSYSYDAPASDTDSESPVSIFIYTGSMPECSDAGVGTVIVVRIPCETSGSETR
jgi:hypothetical protein